MSSEVMMKIYFIDAAEKRSGEERLICETKFLKSMFRQIKTKEPVSLVVV